jgi:hypothetical protein
MTEQEWLATERPWLMLHTIQSSRPSERKVRLFNAAICRRFWDHLPESSQAILSESEALADGLVQATDEMALCWQANEIVAPFDRQYPTKQFPSDEVRIQRWAAVAVCYAVLPNDLWGAVAALGEISPIEKEPYSIIFRDVFANPFRPVVLDHSWLTPKAVALAQQIYDNRAFDRLPVLAGALEEAGCQDEDTLAHCRAPGPHVRGCWVVDLILDKE